MQKHLYNVVICDAHPMFRNMLSNVLAKENQFCVVAKPADRNELSSALARFKPDVILLDIKMLIKDGAAALLNIRKINPFAKVIALTLYDEEETKSKLKELGVQSCIARNSEPDVFYNAIVSEKGNIS